VLQGDVGEANTDVTQIVKLLTAGGAKWNWLLNSIVQFTSAGSVLIFVTKKVCCGGKKLAFDSEFEISEFILYTVCTQI
jgi:hypothetical protein